MVQNYFLTHFLYSKHYARGYFNDDLFHLDNGDAFVTAKLKNSKHDVGRDVLLNRHCMIHKTNRKLTMVAFLSFGGLKQSGNLLTKVLSIKRLMSSSRNNRWLYVLNFKKGQYRAYGLNTIGYIPHYKYKPFLKLIYNKTVLKKRSVFKKFLSLTNFGFIKTFSGVRTPVKLHRLNFLTNRRRRNFIRARRRWYYFKKARMKLFFYPTIRTVEQNKFELKNALTKKKI